MRKLLAVLMITLPMAAAATCTWTTDAGNRSGNVVCTTVTETAFAGTASSALGWPLYACPKGMTLFACVDSGKTLSAAATLSVFVYHPKAALWGKYPDQNITTETITSAASARCQAFDGKWTVVGEGRIAVIPTAGTLDAGNFTIYWSCN